MRKVVYNACYGGFGLSKAAVLRARELSGDLRWGGATLEGEFYSDGSGPSYLFCDDIYLDRDFPRHDPILVQVVEELGREASGSLANLKITEVEGPYRIDEYDGYESVETPDSYEWVN